MILYQLQQKQKETSNDQKQLLHFIESLIIEKASKESALRLGIQFFIQDLNNLDVISQHKNQKNQNLIINVTSLVLYNCQITSTEVLTSFKFPQLRTVQLHVNKLKTFDISQLGSKKLAFLDLSVNQLIDLEGFKQGLCQYLKYINLSKKNKLQNFSVFAGLSFPSLKQFIVSSNSIRGIKQLVTLKFQQLSVLQLGNNHIISLQNLNHANLNTLTRLCLNQNLISNVRPISKCYLPQLKHLDLSSNNLSDLNSLQKLSSKVGKIITLILSFNSFADISILTKFIRQRTLKNEYFRFVAQCTQIIENGVLLEQFQQNL